MSLDRYIDIDVDTDIKINVGNLNCCSVPWTWEKSSVFLKIIFLEFVMFYVQIHWAFKKVLDFSLCSICLVQILSTFCLLKAIHRKCWMWLLAISHSSEEFHNVRARRRSVSGCMKCFWQQSEFEQFLLIFSPHSQTAFTLLTLQCPHSPVCWCNCFWGCRLKISLQREVVFSF